MNTLPHCSAWAAVTPESEMREALDAFAAEHGQSWRTKLRLEWMSGMACYGRSRPVAAAVLLRLRNSAAFGPGGLHSYRTTSVGSAERQLSRYFAVPSLLRWEAIHANYLPLAGCTLQQSWVFVDGDAQKVVGAGFTMFPSADVLREALAAAYAGHVPDDAAPTAGAVR